MVFGGGNSVGLFEVKDVIEYFVFSFRVEILFFWLVYILWDLFDFVVIFWNLKLDLDKIF